MSIVYNRMLRRDYQTNRYPHSGQHFMQSSSCGMSVPRKIVPMLIRGVLLPLTLASSSSVLAQDLPQWLIDEYGHLEIQVRPDGQIELNVNSIRFSHSLVLDAAGRDGELERISLNSETAKEMEGIADRLKRERRIPREERTLDSRELISAAKKEILEKLSDRDRKIVQGFLVLRRIVVNGRLKALLEIGYLEADDRAADARLEGLKSDLLLNSRQLYHDAILKLFEGADAKVLDRLKAAFPLDGNWIPTPGLLHSCLLHELKPSVASPSSSWQQNRFGLCLDSSYRLDMLVPCDPSSWTFDVIRSANLIHWTDLPRSALHDFMDAHVVMRSEAVARARAANTKSSRLSIEDEFNKKTIEALDDILSLLPDADKESLKLARFRAAALTAGIRGAVDSEYFVSVFGSNWTVQDARNRIELNREAACEMLGEGGAAFYSDWLDAAFPESRYERVRKVLPSEDHFRKSPFPSEILLNRLFGRLSYSVH